MDEGSGPQRVVIGGSGDEPGVPVSPWARRDGAAAEASEFSFPAPVGATPAPPPAPPPRPPSPDDVWRRDAPDSALPPPASHHPQFTYDEPDAEPVTSDGAPARAPDRTRWIALGVAAVVVALIAGWTVRRGGVDGAAETIDSAPSTTREPDTAVEESVLPGDTLPPARAPTTEADPTTTRPRPTTTTTTVPPVWQESTIEVDPRLTGSTDRLVVATADALVEVDLTTGSARTLATRGGLLRRPVVGVVAGPDWLVATPEDGSAPQVVLDDAEGVPTRAKLDGAEGWGSYWEADTDRFWTVEYDPADGDVLGIRAVDVRSGEQGELVDTNGLWPTMGDPAGGVVVGDQTVGVYTVSGGGSQRLPGLPVALGLSSLLTYRCGESLDDCGYLLVDRATGDERPVPVDPAVGRLRAEWWTPPNPMPQVTSDGRYATFSMRGEQMPVPALLDTETGAVVAFAGTNSAYGLVQPVFSGDEEFVFVVIDGVLTAHELATGEQFPVAPSDEALSTVRVVTLRPPSG